MKKINLITETQIQEWIQELQTVHEQLLNGTFIFSHNDLIPEHQVAKILKVSDRTMRTYRNKNYFHFIKLEGSIFYLRYVFYIDLVLLSHRSRR